MKIAVKNNKIIEIVLDSQRLRTIDVGYEVKWCPDGFVWPEPKIDRTFDVLGNLIERLDFSLAVGDPDPTNYIDLLLLAAHEAEVTAEAAKAQAYIDNLPSRAAIRSTMDQILADAQAATTAAMMKPVIIALIGVVRKLCEVVYWLVRNKAD